MVQILRYYGQDRPLDDTTNNIEKEKTLTLTLLGDKLPGGSLRHNASGEPMESKMNINLKMALARGEAEEYLKKTVTDHTAIDMMAVAKRFMEGPNTPAEFCSGVTGEMVATIRMWMDEENERKGPNF